MVDQFPQIADVGSDTITKSASTRFSYSSKGGRITCWKISTKKWSQWSGSNRRPTVYETVALPLSYIGLSLSTIPHVLNVPYFGRVKVNGKPIRHLPGTLVILAVCCKPTAQSKASPSPPHQGDCPNGLVGVVNELAPDANARTMCSLGTRRNASSAAACAEGWLSG